MSDPKSGDKSRIKQAALNRRKMLLGGTTLAATSALAAGNPGQVAQAQTQPPRQDPHARQQVPPRSQESVTPIYGR